jgi:hypothetical protein
LAGLAAGITDVEDPEGMAFAAGAFGTAAGVMNGALEQRAAEDIAEVRELGGVSVPAANGLRARHNGDK